MGIFSVFSRRRKEKAAQEKPAQVSAPDRIHYADVPAWLDSALSERLAAVEGRTEELFDAIISKKDSLREKIGSLGGQSFDPHDKTYAKVNMAKDAFVKKALAELNCIRQPAEMNDHRMLSDFSGGVLSAVDSIKNATPKQAILISNYFKKQSSEMVAAIKELESAASELSRFLKFDGALLKHVREAKDGAARLAELDARRRVDDINLSKASVQEAAIGNKSATKRKELDLLMQSDEWKLYAESLNRISELESGMKSMEQDANNMLSVLRKPMKKLSHDKKMASLPENPFREVVMAGGSAETLAKSVLEASGAGAIALKPSESERINALSDPALAELRDSYSRTAEEKGLLEKSVGTALLERKNALEQEIAGLDEDGRRARQEVKFLEEKIRRDNEEKQRQLGEARRAVQEAAGPAVVITLQKTAEGA